MWDTLVLVALSVKDFFWKQQQAQYGLDIRPRAVEVDTSAIEGELIAPRDSHSSQLAAASPSSLIAGPDTTYKLDDDRIDELVRQAAGLLSELGRRHEITSREWPIVMSRLMNVPLSSNTAQE